jgi:ATP-dependent DNA helicase RecG
MEHRYHEYKHLSKRAEELLQHEEGLEVEFKQSQDAMDIGDIIAFANSPYGGTILIGIKEVIAENGRQRGVIVGCRTGDKEKLKLISKINNITPQLKVDIYVENLEKRPFYRLEIPSGPDKPYCSSSGEYKIRDDGHVKPLFPETMLKILLEREGEKFHRRFEHSTTAVEEAIFRLAKSSKKELDDVENNLQELNKRINELIKKLDKD